MKLFLFLMIFHFTTHGSPFIGLQRKIVQDNLELGHQLILTAQQKAKLKKDELNQLGFDWFLPALNTHIKKGLPQVINGVTDPRCKRQASFMIPGIIERIAFISPDDNDFEKHRFTLCPIWFSSPSLKKVSTFIHEFAHFALQDKIYTDKEEEELEADVFTAAVLLFSGFETQTYCGNYICRQLPLVSSKRGHAISQVGKIYDLIFPNPVFLHKGDEITLNFKAPISRKLSKFTLSINYRESFHDGSPLKYDQYGFIENKNEIHLFYKPTEETKVSFYGRLESFKKLEGDNLKQLILIVTSVDYSGITATIKGYSDLSLNLWYNSTENIFNLTSEGLQKFIDDNPIN